MQGTRKRAYSGFEAVHYNSSREPDRFLEKVTVEEPLEIRLKKRDGEEIPISVIMRTPVLDRYLTVGFLFSEAIISSKSQIISVNNLNPEGNAGDNVIIVEVSDDVDIEKVAKTRNFTVNSSCGICGKGSINDVFLRSGRLVKSETKVTKETILSLPAKMLEMQQIFSETGGIHAAGIFTSTGKPIFVAEDIGRHNAVDKVVGYMLLNDLVFSNDIMMQVSGRAGFEILQKAAMAGIPVVSSVSAPSSLAIELAESMNMTLLCFVREKRFNIYTHPERIVL